MVAQHHRSNGHELGQTLGNGEGQGSLACCSPWGHLRVGHNLATEKQTTNITDNQGNLILPSKHTLYFFGSAPRKRQEFGFFLKFSGIIIEGEVLDEGDRAGR